ncbi:MAG TPA: hypothetical protein VGS22_16890 [Thermoanaerobaculia bacterium]|jgi:hypothetical protein|nr:hypothetical protein [Thermoanaerobaculia bacterium]
MNRKIKKLELNRETVRGLDDRSLGEVQGAATELSVCGTCGSCTPVCQTLATKRCTECCF